MKNRLIIALVFVVPLLAYGVLAQVNPQKAQELAKSYQAVAQKSQSAKIIKFSVPLCMDCEKLDNTLKKVMPKYSNNVYLQRVDATSSNSEVQAMVKKYNVKIAPTTIFINSKGKMVKKIEGDIPEKTLEKEIKALF